MVNILPICTEQTDYMKKEKQVENTFDAIVVGSGHAGCEAALALARTGHNTLMVTLNLDSIAFLSCNPSVGGTAKGHLVCEIDALGGQMGETADACTISMRMLNSGKGAAVQSLRAQVDKEKYHAYMKKVLESTPKLHIKQGEISKILTENGETVGVELGHGISFFASKVIVATGVYLSSRIITGEYVKEQGPNGFSNATLLSGNLERLGFAIRRFKTGTPARLDGRTIAYDKLEAQGGDIDVRRFSFMNTTKAPNLRDCYLGYTNERTHDIIKANLKRAPMYSGGINGVGARYCPSIEDKVVRFSDKSRHQFFLEPEALGSSEVYLQGISTSMPAELQQEIVNSCEGLDSAWIMRYAYAIEYDCIDSTELLPTLEAKRVKGLYFAGQINGTSGYEEAGAQGLIAGINAHLALKGEEPLIVGRDQGYIGVLIDDLVTKGTNEPYRMMTSRAEYRLSLRQDNADERLTPLGIRVGLANAARARVLNKKLKAIAELDKKLDIVLPPNAKLNTFLKSHDENEVKTGITVRSLIKRPDITLTMIEREFNLFGAIARDVLEQVDIRIKYEGYISLESKHIEDMRKMEELKVPELDYCQIKGLRLEARQKLDRIKPINVGQASRISGVSPADIAVLLIYIKTMLKK